MWKKWTALLLALTCLAAPALAEVYEGVTEARSAVTVRVEKAGAVASVTAQVGQRVAEGDALVTLSAEKAFASQDGTVSLLNAHEGDAVSGTVLEIAPVERYTVHCTVDKAYQSAAHGHNVELSSHGRYYKSITKRIIKEGWRIKH